MVTGHIIVTMAEIVVGVDGRKGGWIAAEHDIRSGALAFRPHDNITGLLGAYPDDTVIAIDIPIGLSETLEARSCDRAARKFVGPRGSSVFPAPDRRLLSMKYPEASAFSREHCGKGVTRQSHAIFMKIAEVDAAMSPELQRRVIEVHPEVCFRGAAGCHMKYYKRTKEGFQERHAVLQRVFAQATIPERRRLHGAAPDDILDAAIAAWTAMRHARGQAEQVFPAALRDPRGLLMSITF